MLKSLAIVIGMLVLVGLVVGMKRGLNRKDAEDDE
jgi:hypothetical protein